MSEGHFDTVDLLPPTLTATALAEELAEYEAALAAVHFEGSFDEVPSYEPFDSQPVVSESVSPCTGMPFPAVVAPAGSGAFEIGLVSHVDVVNAVGLFEEEEEVPPTMRSPSSTHLVVSERPVRVTMDETPSSDRVSVELPIIKVA
ncbi:hypothetical protein LVJ94_11215 [Pendulispora rubella]|uniref:Uncharacterized protein n=1 Tax=Pendulispora rubella TaxID=2741070 RepID=A0ABZ2LF51_9BACT